MNAAMIFAQSAAAGGTISTDGGNAVQLLLLVGGVTLVPALLFSVTGFTRILVVLGFIRTGLGTPTAPPNQVLVGIALFLTIFVMAPTFTEVKTDAIDPLTAGQDHAGRGASSAARSRCASSCSARRATKDLALFVKLAQDRPARRRAPTCRPTS